MTLLLHSSRSVRATYSRLKTKLHSSLEVRHDQKACVPAHSHAPTLLSALRAMPAVISAAVWSGLLECRSCASHQQNLLSAPQFLPQHMSLDTRLQSLQQECKWTRFRGVFCVSWGLICFPFKVGIHPRQHKLLSGFFQIPPLNPTTNPTYTCEIQPLWLRVLFVGFTLCRPEASEIKHFAFLSRLKQKQELQ